MAVQDSTAPAGVAPLADSPLPSPVFDISLPADVPDPCVFASLFEGDAMDPSIQDGDIVIYSPALPFEENQLYYVELRGEPQPLIRRVSTLRRGDQRAGFVLTADNAPPRQVTTPEVARLARAVYVCRKLKLSGKRGGA